MNKKIISLLIVILVYFSVINAQLVTTDPSVPTDTNPVTIYFDASQGSQGLMNYSGDIYAHAGVITNLSSSGSDWKYVIAGWSENTTKAKMTRVSTNLYSLEITPSIRDFYGVPVSEQILQMAFVFRNEDGSKTGKTETGGDIFIDVFEEGLNVKLVNPTESSLVVELNDQIVVEASATLSTSISLYINNSFVVSGATATELDYTITADTDGEFWVRVEATDGLETVADSFFYFVRPSVVVEDLPMGIEPGINYIDDNTVILALYAPNKNYVFALGDFSDWVARADNYMKNTIDGNTWWIELTGLTAGKEYIYQYFVDGILRIGDPYADKTSDPNDKWIPNETYPGLIEYPWEKTTGVATVIQTAQQDYVWANTSFIPPSKEDLVIYELHIRDFIAKHDYKTLIDTIDYLDRLGINAIELMPVNEFEGNESWGYNPSYYFAPDKYYGPKNKLKTFIDSCHSQGIAVILDMVLNHSYGQSPLTMLYWDANAGDWGQPSAENPWYNQVSPNPVYAWGSDFDHESDDTKAFVDRVNKYWLSEYKFDGFRFDFTKGFTNTPGDGGAYDAARINILKRMALKIWETNSNAYVILEHFAENSEEKSLADFGMMIWGNMNHDYLEASMGYTSNLSWGSYQSRGWNDPHLVTYMESHDEERMMFKNISYGNSNDTYNVKQLWIALQRAELTATFFFTIPGPKMIWQFGELGYDVSIDVPCRVCNKPILWDYYEVNDRLRLYQVYSSLADLKVNEPAFGTDNFQLNTSGMQKRINLYHADMDVVVLGNFDIVPGNIDPNFSVTGRWYEYFTGDSVDVTGTSDLIDLEAGEYRIYTTKRLTTPDIITDVKDLPISKFENSGSIKIYPNPSSSGFQVALNTKEQKSLSLEIFNLSGKKVNSLYTGEHFGLLELYWDGSNNAGLEISSGMYFLHARIGDEHEVYKLIKQ
ncbi:MAG: alpha-amylase family glycosyl hydrolase [Bacteroidota bacterium]|nr:alpha-amylase family glycosyl hydrolase [Bacteroidota bacterium]